MTSRRQGRELAFRAVYQADVTGETPRHCLEEILEETPSSDEIRLFAATLVQELEEHRDNVDAIVSRTAHNWPLRRMAATDRSVLRVAVVELLHHAETPTRVALDEAIEIAKKYGSETSGSFVNGILDRIAHDERPSAG
ncbi:MAG TPA: transcription antitermination factor NusB [Candidatus Eisenbacteria bacterium]|nr:transcription antitermination factor NusB [Candidatus Eisenbacteria bacterium]